MNATRATFVSAIPYEQQRIYAAAIYCSDGRLGDHIDEFLHTVLGLPRYDRVACPGGPVGLAGRLAAFWETRGVEAQLRFLAQVHDIRKVVLIGHADCAYYTRRLLLAPDRVEAEQRHDLHAALWTVREMVPGIEVTAYWASIQGTQVAFEAL